jgi:transcriptional antiterminator RfaH
MTNEQFPPWYVLQSRPRRELLVASLLERVDEVKIFLPEVFEPKRRGHQLAPLFPGYLFVQVDLQSNEFEKIRRTPGVIGFVGNERHPSAVDAAVVQQLQEQLQRLNAKGGLHYHNLEPGNPITIVDGPLRGLNGVFIGGLRGYQRVQILLDFLGQEQRVTIDGDWIERDSTPHPSQAEQRSRRTRGKGRPIHHQ